jgi:hypothetical protein
MIYKTQHKKLKIGARKVWRYSGCNQKLYIKGQTIQWPKEKGQTMIYKTLHRKLKIEARKVWRSDYLFGTFKLFLLQSLVFCLVFYRSLFVLFLLVIVLSVLWFTASDYLFGIFKLFLPQSLVFCVVFYRSLFVLFLLVTVLSVLW